MTGRQRGLLAFLHDTIARTGRCPSIKVAAEHLGRAQPTVSRMMSRLELEGYIQRDPQRRRVYSVVTPAVFTKLCYEELAWCQANPERVRAMMKIAGAQPTREHPPRIAPGGI